MSQSEIYLPLLEEFCRQNEEEILSSGYPYLPFIPIAFSNYDISNPKIFYVGIDTYHWIRATQELLKYYHAHTLSVILELKEREVTPKRILQDWYSDKGRFWEFVCKLHLYIRTGKVLNNDNLRNLSSAEVEMIKEIGWGNMNSVELEKTLRKEGEWDAIDPSKYYRLKRSSENLLDPIMNLIQAFEPNYIILLGWGENEEHVFKGLNYEVKDEFYEQDFRALYQLKDYRTKIIWTCHPCRFRFLSTNQEEMIPYVGDSLKLF